MTQVPILFSRINENKSLLLVPSYSISLEKVNIHVCSSLCQHMSAVIINLEMALFGRDME